MADTMQDKLGQLGSRVGLALGMSLRAGKGKYCWEPTHDLRPGPHLEPLLTI